MQTDDILKTLHRAARAIRLGGVLEPYNKAELIQSYNELTALIQNILSQYDFLSARKACEVVSDRPQDPRVWREPAISVALKDVTHEHYDEIHNAAYILASRLPGKTKIPRKKPFPRPGKARSSMRDRFILGERYSAERERGEVVGHAGRADDEDEGEVLG